MPEVSKVTEAMEVIKVREVVPWKERATVECMHASQSASHAEVVCPAEAMDATKASHTARAVHTAEAVASHAAHHHRMGRHHWHGKHRHHDSASNRYFAEHDNPPDCHSPAP
jgi:hypothetical protein